MTAVPLEIPGWEPEPPPAPLHVAGELLYESPLASVWWGRAEEILPRVVKESVDLILTDPPYGADFQSNRRALPLEKIDNDTASDRPTIHAILQHCVRVVGQNRHLYVFGPSDVLDGLKVAQSVELIWDKGTLGSGNVAAAWAPSHEPITFTVSKHRHGGETGRSTVPARLRKGSVLRYTRPTGRKVWHPNEKPVPLLRELIESSSRQGDLVLDPFAGSMSTGVAALMTARRCLLIESKEAWARRGAERIAEAEAAIARLAHL
jgi:DNA modification methylase